MASSSNRLVVEVVGDTTKLTRSLNQAQQQINKFASQSKIKSTGANAFLADIRGLSAQTDDLIKKQQEVAQRSVQVNTAFARMGAGTVVAGFAVNALGRNFSELGGEFGKFGNALSALSTGNLVGFVKAANNGAESASKFGKALVEQGDFAKANAEANKLARIGFDDMAKAARAAADQIAAVEKAQRQLIAFTAISGGTFGITPLDPLLGKTGPTAAAQRPGVSASQRNTFFDNKITRELDRARDLPAQLQIKRLQEIRAEIEARIAKTNDPTRKLTLSDEIASINREITSLNEGIAAGLKSKAKAVADAKTKLIQSFKSQAEDIKSAVLDAFDTKTDKIHNARDLKDAQKTLRQARQLGGAGSIETAMRGVEDANRAITRQRILDTRFSVGEGPRGPVNAVSVGNITFNITTSDPDKVASVVLKKLQLSNRHGSPQGRGRAPGAWTGLH